MITVKSQINSCYKPIPIFRRSRSRSSSVYRSSKSRSHRSRSRESSSRSKNRDRYKRSKSRSRSKDRQRSRRSGSRSYIREYVSKPKRHSSTSSESSSSDKSKISTSKGASRENKRENSNSNDPRSKKSSSPDCVIVDTTVLSEINEDKFTPKQFNSSKSKKIPENIVIDLQKNTIKVPEVEQVEPDSIFHHNVSISGLYYNIIYTSKYSKIHHFLILNTPEKKLYYIN